MKKSQKVQLVLITAALASCNRTFFPSQPDPVYDNPAYVQSQTDTDSAGPCAIDPAMYDCYYPYYYTGTYYPGWSFQVYLNLRPVYRGHGVFRRRGFIPRGGFGKTAVTAVS